MLREVLRDGCQDAGVAKEEIGTLNEQGKIACFVGSYLNELFNNQSHIGALFTEVGTEYYGMPAARYEAAGASGAAAIDAAAAKIAAGRLDVAIVVGWALVNTVDAATGQGYVSRSA